MAEAVIVPLLGKLQQLAVSEVQILVSVSEDIERLRDKLTLVQAFLRDVDLRQRARSDEFTRAWLRQIREAVFDAQDAVEHYFLRDDLSRYPSWIPTSVRFLANFPTQLRVRHRLSRKIPAINSRLEEILKNKHVYRVDEAPDWGISRKTPVYRVDEAPDWPIPRSSHSISTRRTFAVYRVDEAPDWPIPRSSHSISTRRTFASTTELDLHHQHLAIHKEERKKLEEALTTTTEQERKNKDYHPVMISVFGKSGVGKTTLVRNIYKVMAKKSCFDVQAMESFAPYLTANNILHQIVQQLTEDNKNCPRSMVPEMLAKELRNKKYLLVIDGEVSSTEWKHILSLLTTLKLGAEGSRIVHIRLDKPAEPPSYRHVVIQLNTLQDSATIELFRKRLLHIEVQDPKKLEEYHQDICEITGGLPLAVVLLSGLVQTKEFPHEWTEVFKYLRSKQSKRLDSILSLCFDDLPHELKCCFLYFAALPDNIIVEARNLVCMWMAEGFLRQTVEQTMEKVGYIYFNELIARNLVNPVLIDDDSSAGSKFVAIQNKVHDFLQSEAHEASFVEVHSGDDIPTLTSARRLSLQNYTEKYAALASPLPKLRSIFSHFEQEPKEEDHEHKLKGNRTNLCCKPQQRAIYKKKKDIKSHIRGLLRGSEFLRVIDLHGIEIGEKLPDAIGSVVLLQYLGITSCSLKEIPQSIGSLTGLQTLDVRETYVRKLPLAFWKIKTLRHVFGFVLELPKQIGSLKHLQTLNCIKLDDYEQSLAETLGEMIHLENLFVWHILNDNMKALSIALTKLENLRTLALYGDNIPSSVFTTISLRRLKFMVLQGKMELSSELDGMDEFLPNLSMLSLTKTNVSQGFITNLGELPSLATLALYSGSYKGEHLLFPSTGFLRLKKIKLDAETLKTIDVDVGALPNLQEFDILSEQYQDKINAEQRIMETIV